MITEYPFGDTVVIKVIVPPVMPSSRGYVPLHMRIPGWAKNAAMDVETTNSSGDAATADTPPLKLRAGTMHTVQCLVRVCRLFPFRL